MRSRLRPIARLVLPLLALAMTGCIHGLLYSRTTRPLGTDFENTPVSHAPPARDSLKQVRWRYVDVRWDSNAIGDIAREGGLGKIYYVDQETVRYVIFTRSYLNVYGEPAPEPDGAP